MSTEYSELYEISELQRSIMIYIGQWAKAEKQPIPQRAIIERMKIDGIKDFTTINAVHSLLKKGYIRRAVITSNKTFYVQLRTV